jgi:hypothetical protein
MKLADQWLLIKFTAVVFLSLAAFSVADAQERGDTVVFLIAHSFPQPTPPARPSDVLIFTGRSLGTLDTTGCLAGEHPVYQAILVDRDAARASRRIEVVVLSHQEVSPGTRVNSLIAQSSCVSGGTTYNRYEGTVD